MLTLKDIARHVGVSASTVSLVLNDRDRGRVNPSVAATIRRTADDMGYVPNLLARGLKTRKSHTIGMLSDGVASIPFAGGMVRGAQDTAWTLGYLLMLIDSGGNHDLDSAAVKSLLQRDIEALVFAAEFHRDVELPLVPTSVPVVVLDGRSADRTDVDSVVPDEEQGGYDAARHLLEAGHRRIAYCGVADERYIAATLRRRGYERALADAGIALDESIVVAAPGPETRDGFPSATALLSRSDRPTAVFCFSDRLAFAFYQAAGRLGLRVPEDLSIVGFDNQIAVADSVLPGLTSVALPHAEMGSWAMERAVLRIRGESSLPYEHRLMRCPLVLRESVGPPG